MLIKVTDVGGVETKKEGKRRWKEIRLEYETADKDDNYKILLDWANPDAFADAQDCEIEKFYDVKVVKSGKFWNWESITESDATEFDTSPRTKSYEKATQSKGTDWAAKNALDKERFEFDKEKQGLIIRQSCIGYAIQMLKVSDNYPQLGAVISLASKLEDQVEMGFVIPAENKTATDKPKSVNKPMNKPDPDNPDDDIPF